MYPLTFQPLFIISCHSRPMHIKYSLQLQILVGSGNSFEETGFGEFYPQRMFNGRVIYEKIPASDSGNTVAKVKEDSAPGESNEAQVPALAVPTRVYLDTLWNGGIKNSGSKSTSFHRLPCLQVFFIIFDIFAIKAPIILRSFPLCMHLPCLKC